MAVTWRATPPRRSSAPGSPEARWGAAGLPQPRLTGEARSYAERLFSFPVISSLSESDATAALVEPANTTPITVADLEAAMPAAQQALDSSIYEVRIQRTTDQERRYMRAMAELGSGPYRSGDVAAKLGRKTSQVSVVRQRLLEKGLVHATEDYGYVDFTVPRFGEFMARYMPFRLPRRRKPPG